jgi:hypothetical protein
MTNDIPSPDSVPSALPENSVLHVIPLKELGKKESGWTLTVHPDHLVLAENGAERPPCVIRRDEVLKSPPMFVESIRAFSVQSPRKITFQLTPEGNNTLAEWVGLPVLAAFHLKQRFSWALPVAIIWTLGSLPWSPFISSDVTLPFNPFGFGLGVFLMVTYVLARYRPRPILFLFDALGVLGIGIYFVAGVINGRSKYWLVLVLVLVLTAIGGFRKFVRYRNTIIPPR